MWGDGETGYQRVAGGSVLNTTSTQFLPFLFLYCRARLTTFSRTDSGFLNSGVYKVVSRQVVFFFKKEKEEGKKEGRKKEKRG